MHHIFVHCPTFDSLRHNYHTNLSLDVMRLLAGLPTHPHLYSHLKNVLDNLFGDRQPWPLASSRFYLGLLPPLIPPSINPSSLSPAVFRLTSKFAHRCHTSAIRLTAQIWGLVLRNPTFPAPNSATSTSNFHPSLPDHLLFLRRS
jgi:hypothetical protein